MVTIEQIKSLRDKTGVSVGECKKALEETNGDMEKALKVLERRLGNLAGKRTGRETRAGVIDSYIHSNGRIGVLVELLSETDFVSRNQLFRELAHDISMHVAAVAPLYLSPDAIPEEVMAAQRKIFAEEVASLKKPQNISEQIIGGKLKSHFDALTLLTQSYVKDSDKTVAEAIDEAIGKFGENIRIGRFVRFEL